MININNNKNSIQEKMLKDFAYYSAAALLLIIGWRNIGFTLQFFLSFFR